jgi:hypothetical protein
MTFNNLLQQWDKMQTAQSSRIRHRILATALLLTAIGIAGWFFAAHSPLDAAAPSTPPASPASQIPVVSGQQATPAIAHAKPSTAKPSALQQDPLYTNRQLLVDKISAVLRDYPALVAKAKSGDVDAAMRLYESMRGCWETPRTPAALADHVEQAGVNNPVDSPEYARQVASLNARLQLCGHFSNAQVDEWRTWLALAAERGDSEVQLTYVLDGRPREPHSDTYFHDSREYVFAGAALFVGGRRLGQYEGATHRKRSVFGRQRYDIHARSNEAV